MIADKLLKIIAPDWQFTGTTAMIEKEFNGFKIAGAGWYAKEGTWLLAVPAAKENEYTLLLFFDRDPREVFWAMAKAPVYSDAVKTPIAKIGLSYKGMIAWVVSIITILPVSNFLHHRFSPGVGALLTFIYIFICGMISNHLLLRNIKPKGKKNDAQPTQDI